MSYWLCKNCGEKCCVNEELGRLRAENARLKDELREVRKDIIANATDTLWSHEGLPMTIVDRIDHALNDGEADKR